MKLPRGLCPVCKTSVAIRRNGAIREHRLVLAGKPRKELCGGSGQLALVGEESVVRRERPSFFSCRITTRLTVTVCSIKHTDVTRALNHARRIQHGMGERALTVEVVTAVADALEA